MNNNVNKHKNGADACALLDGVIDIAADAGRRIVEVYNQEFTIQHKDDKTPLTEADMAAHDAIESGLPLLTPEIPILSEESAAISFSVRKKWQRYWLVDPLDGTREFIKRNGEFTVNIALIEDGTPVLGVILAPVTGMCYYGCRGHGAYKRTSDTPAQPIHTVSWQGRHIRVAGSRSHGSDAFNEFLSHFEDHELVVMGSSLKSCLVAEGKADIYPRFGRTSEWDTAAAQCIVEEAGGAIVDLNLQPLRYNTKESLLNPHFVVIGDTHHDWSHYLKTE
jgi:3'(2'), 5'-bisphosphate nucleotidase